MAQSTLPINNFSITGNTSLEGWGYDSTINGYTGMGVSLIIIGLGLYMIVSIKNTYKDKRI